MFSGLGLDSGQISTTVFLVTPKNFGNSPVATPIDARKEISMLRRQLARMERVEGLLDLLPPDVTFDLAYHDGEPTRPPQELTDHLRQVPAHYRPSCATHCGLAGLCRDEALTSGSLDLFGPGVSDVFGGVDTTHTALALAEGTRTPADDQDDIARVLRHAARLRAELQEHVA